MTSSTAIRAPELREVAALMHEAERRGVKIPAELEYEVYLQDMYRRGLNPWDTFRSYIEYLNPSLFRFEHIEKLVEVAEQVVAGEIKRLLVLLPPRYLKTEVFGRLLCSYFLRKHPHRLVGLASYNASKAWEVSAWVRTYFERSGGKLRPSAEAKKFWGPPEGGEFWAVGINEGSIGRGFHLGILDDPIDPEKSRSAIHRKRFQEWYPTKWLSRQEPEAAIIVVMQRLGIDDPIDFLYRREVGENTTTASVGWHVLVMDEIKSDEPLGRWDGPQGLPPTCTLVEDTRAIGEVLAESRFSPEAVEQLQAEAGPVTAACQRQQRPMRPTGDFWTKPSFRIYDKLPSGAYNGGKDWDTAYTKDEANSATAWVESYRGPGKDEEFPIYIENVDWDWREFPQLVEWMKELRGPHYVEEKATGKSVIQALKVYGIVAAPISVLGDKFSRASAAQPAVANRRVWVRREVYDLLLFGESQGLLRITAESLQASQGGLDLNDAFVQALHRHLGLGSRKEEKRAQWA